MTLLLEPALVKARPLPGATPRAALVQARHGPGRLKRLAFALGAIATLLLAEACSSGPSPIASSASSPSASTSGTVLVVINRTTTPVLLSVGTVPACSRLELDQATIAAAVARALSSPSDSVSATDAVDWSPVSISRKVGAPLPGYLLITGAGGRLAWGAEPAIPPCSGKPPPVPQPQ